jgi:tetratricopeptide (TPR) repeat protein
MNPTYRLAALLMGTTVLVAQPFHWEKATAQVSIGKLAQDVTVFIQGVSNPDNFGSGVIIGHSGKNYTVLTAAHVVSGTDQFTIQTGDGLQYNLKSVQRLSNIDMAIVQFDSSSSYQTARLGNSDQISLTSTVYVAGFPKPGQNITVPVLAVTNGEIAQVLPANSARDGYGFAYTNSTRAGMSGGPVFNSGGEVIAIHGRKEGEVGGGATNGAWVNLGIPINRYKAGGSQIARDPGVDLQQKEAQRQAALEAQRKAQEQSQQQAALEAQRKAQEQSQQQAALEAQRKAQEQSQQQAALENQRKAQQQAQQQAALEAQRKAQEKAQQQAALENQRKAQQQAQLEAQQKSQAQAQRQAALQAQQKSQAQAQQQSAAAGQKSREASAKAVLSATSPFVAAVQSRPAVTNSTRQVCEDIRINTIVTKRCHSEAVNQLQESASGSTANSSETYVNSGNDRASNGNYQKAIEEYSTAIKGNSSLAIAFFNRGLAFYNLGRKDPAIADFSKAADLFRSQGDSEKLRKTQDILQALTQANS